MCAIESVATVSQLLWKEQVGKGRLPAVVRKVQLISVIAAAVTLRHAKGSSDGTGGL